jgi:hypothetical protein
MHGSPPIILMSISKISCLLQHLYEWFCGVYNKWWKSTPSTWWKFHGIKELKLKELAVNGVFCSTFLFKKQTWRIAVYNSEAVLPLSRTPGGDIVLAICYPTNFRWKVQKYDKFILINIDLSRSSPYGRIHHGLVNVLFCLVYLLL